MGTHWSSARNNTGSRVSAWGARCTVARIGGAPAAASGLAPRASRCELVYRRGVIARVRELREIRREALGAAAALGMSILFITQELRPHVIGSMLGYGIFAFLLVAWTAAPLLLRWARPVTGRVVLGDRRANVCGVALDADDVVGLSLVPAVRGASLALSTVDGRTRFVEVGSMEDGRRIASALGARSLPQGPLFFRVARDLRVVERVLIALAAVCAVFYWGSATYVMHIVSGGKSFFGMPLLGLAIVQSVLLLVRGLLDRRFTRKSDDPPRDDLRMGLPRGALFDHVRLHLGPRDAAPSPEKPRAARLAPAQGEEGAAWLARVDALQVDAGYREDATTAEELWTTLADPYADTLERAAAARVLRRWNAAPAQEIRARVAEPEVRARVDVALEGDAEEVEQALAKMGPLFRA